VVMANTGIPTGDGGNRWLKVWLFVMKYLPSFPWGIAFKPTVKAEDFDDNIFDAYRKAPFPQRKYQAGIRQFPQLISIFPDNPGVPQNRAAWKKLKQFNKPLLTLYGNLDPVTKGQEAKYIKGVPGAKGQNHKIIKGGGHFIQEDKPDELVAEIIPFLDVS
jgi:haloalkane dehalogenase